MWSTYRLMYLCVAALVMGGVVFVAAEAEHGHARAGLTFGTLLAQQLQAATESEAAEDGGTESGNLSEAGAKEIKNEGDFLLALVASKDKPVLIFKHSTACEVSGAAYRRTAEWLEERGESAPPVFLVKVIEHRSASEFIAKQMRVTHESPQAILMRNGRAVWNADHEEITAEALDGAIDRCETVLPGDETTD